MLDAAHRYELAHLKEKCGIYLFEKCNKLIDETSKSQTEIEKGKEKANSRNEKEDEISHLLQIAELYECHELERLCAEHMALHFADLNDGVRQIPSRKNC